MTFLDLDQRSSNQPLSRSTYLGVIQAGLLARKFKFSQEIALNWLAAFPGDLSAGLYYAQALIGSGLFSQALPILQGLCMADPEFLEAAQELHDLQSIMLKNNYVEALSGADKKISNVPNKRTVFAPGVAAQAYYFALTGKANDEALLPTWSSELWLVRQALEQGQISRTEAVLKQVASLQVSNPLIAVTHLRYLSETQSVTNLENRQKIAARYYQTWPDCLACALFKADWLLENGDSGMAVALLHQVAARDIGGQVARRIWGDSHPYLPLWPEKMELALGLAAPADVARILGWNQISEQAYSIEQKKKLEALSANKFQAADSWSDEDTQSIKPRPALDQVSQLPDTGQPETGLGENGTNGIDAKSQLDDLLPLRKEIERLAKRFHLHGLVQQDGRFPIYIVLSVRSNLENYYGKKASEIIAELNQLASEVGKRKRWGGRVILVDDEKSMGSVGLSPVQNPTAWNIKLALVDLDKALAKRGEMIGAILIAGGSEIVPFHFLPNPVDDQDDQVPSDNPYANRDENYFIPEWPVGRLPGGASNEASVLLGMLRKLKVYHQKSLRPSKWIVQVYRNILKGLNPNRFGKKSGFGYTAAVWRNAAEQVFKPIGDPGFINSSPPLGLGDMGSLSAKKNGKTYKIPSPKSTLAYFNLHGLVDSAEWYGQRDPLDPEDGPNYPVALRPADIKKSGPFTGNFPQVVFSEACYGVNILGKKVDEAISLKFLESGSLVVAGSTCMSYGSIDTPLVAADLLGYEFWKNFQDGLPAGEALRLAKINLVNEMHQRQGYLDGEDQKTIISFVLYGDPLVSRETIFAKPQAIQRSVDTLDKVITVSDRVLDKGVSQEIPAEVMASVKQVVAQYLPGMSNAQVLYATQRNVCQINGHEAPHPQTDQKAQLKKKLARNPGNQDNQVPDASPGSAKRRLVTLSKRVPNTHGVHSHVARLTLDDQGQLVKLVVSR